MELLNLPTEMLGKYEARGVEQYLIETLGMKVPKGATKKVGLLENLINSMSKKHRHYDEGIKYGKQWVNDNQPKIVAAFL